MKDIRQYLTDHILLFDGAMGTYYASKHGRMSSACEKANIETPEDIISIHREYLSAGAKAIKTNTFSCNKTVYEAEECTKLITAGWQLAVDAASDYDAYVFADIGPVTGSEIITPEEEYIYLADTFLSLGAKHFLFETNSTSLGIMEAACHIRQKKPESFIIVSFAVMPDGFTGSGQAGSRLLKKVLESPYVDAAGFNCVSGSRHMVMLSQTSAVRDLIDGNAGFLCMMPNAGYPQIAGNSMVFESASEYFAEQSMLLASQGVHILGGCCGTTPEYTAAVYEQLEKRGFDAGKVRAEFKKKLFPEEQISENKFSQENNPFWKLVDDPSKKPFAVELDPPDAADTSRFLAGVSELKEAGASIITIADCPIARARMDSSLLACKIKRELSMEALPHMTCRDRNLNATKALLLGLYAEGIRNVLTITGDPIPTANRDEIKSVFNFNSRMLADYIRTLGETMLQQPFRVFGALNVNAVNFESQLNSARKKIENGISGFLTQPILTEKAFDNLKTARKELDAKILGGIIPIVSHKNALFMNNEVSGIKVDEQIIARYEGVDREKGEELAVEISKQIARLIKDYVDGFYLITPFSRTGLICRIMNAIRDDNITKI